MIEAVIFDMDGVIVDSKPNHMLAWKKFCARHNLRQLGKPAYNKIAGRSTAYFLQKLFGRKLSRKEIVRYSVEKNQIYLQTYKKRIAPVGGLVKFLKKLHFNKILAAVATSEPLMAARFLLRKTGTTGYFAKVLARSASKNPKPHPEIYLKTSGFLKVAPRNCLVIEDSRSGITAAKAARMKVVAIATTHKKSELEKFHPDQIINNFYDLKLNKFFI